MEKNVHPGRRFSTRDPERSIKKADNGQPPMLSRRSGDPVIDRYPLGVIIFSCVKTIIIIQGTCQCNLFIVITVIRNTTLLLLC